MKLYEIKDEYLNLFNELEELDEINPDDINRLAEIQGNFEDKAINIAAMIKNLKAESIVIESECAKLIAKNIRLDNKIEALKNYLEFNMNQVNLEKIESSLHKIKFKRNPPSLFITDEKFIPDKYKEEVIEIRIKNARIKEDLKNGMEVPGAQLVSKVRLDIK